MEPSPQYGPGGEPLVSKGALMALYHGMAERSKATKRVDAMEQYQSDKVGVRARGTGCVLSGVAARTRRHHHLCQKLPACARSLVGCHVPTAVHLRSDGNSSALWPASATRDCMYHVLVIVADGVCVPRV